MRPMNPASSLAASVLSALAGLAALLSFAGCSGPSRAESERLAEERAERKRLEDYARAFAAAERILGAEFNLRVADPDRGYLQGTYPKDPAGGGPGQIREWVHCVVRLARDPPPRIAPDPRTGGNLPAEGEFPQRAVDGIRVGEAMVLVTVLPVHGKRAILSGDLKVESRVWREQRSHEFTERRLREEIAAEADRIVIEPPPSPTPAPSAPPPAPAPPAETSPPAEPPPPDSGAP